MIDETFVPAAEEAPVPQNADEWNALRERWLADLRAKSFDAWPEDKPNDSLTLDVAQIATSNHGDYRVSLYEFTSQSPYRLPLLVIRKNEPITQVILQVVDQSNWGNFEWAVHAATGNSKQTEDDADGAFANRL